MYCKNCGSFIKEDVKFCGYCGAVVELQTLTDNNNHNYLLQPDTPVQQPFDAIQSDFPQPVYHVTPKTSSNTEKIILIVGLSLALVVTVCLLLYAFSPGFRKLFVASPRTTAIANLGLDETGDTVVADAEIPAVVDNILAEADYKQIIKNFVKTEDAAARDGNFSSIWNYFAADMRRYYNYRSSASNPKHRPTYDNLLKEYEAAWKKADNQNNDIEDIETINPYTFNLHTSFSLRRITGEKAGMWQCFDSVLRFVFDDYGKITEIYSISTREVYCEDYD